MDSLLIYAPALLLAWWETPPRGRALGAAALGQLPFILWEIFSLVYYGFPFPNTAYAKLNTGIPRIELLQQGGKYLLSSLRHDPLTLTVGCLQDGLVLAANKDLIAQVSDPGSTLTGQQGDIGLIAGTWQNAGAVIDFDDLVVYQP